MRQCESTCFLARSCACYRQPLQAHPQGRESDTLNLRLCKSCHQIARPNHCIRKPQILLNLLTVNFLQVRGRFKQISFKREFRSLMASRQVICLQKIGGNQKQCDSDRAMSRMFASECLYLLQSDVQYWPSECVHMEH
jgi:hypothetical protein